MAHQYQKELEQARNIISEASDTVNKLLAADALFSIRTNLNEKYNQQVNFINGLLGNVVTIGSTVSALPTLGPVTNFLGEAVNREKPVTVDAITVGPTEKEIFLQKRDAFYDTIPSLTNADVLKQLKLPSGDLIIRSCAKRAGITNFADASLNTKFIDALRKKIVAEQESEKAIQEADELVKAQMSATPPAPAADATTETTIVETANTNAPTGSEGAE